VLTCGLQVIPLVVLAAALAARTLTESQSEAVRSASGARGLLQYTARYVFPVSFSAALIGALMTLSDPGTGQIMGYHGIASEILIAFASKHDAALAARKAIAMGLVLSPVVVWLSWKMAYWADRQFLGRDLRRAEPIELGAKRWAFSAGFLIFAVGLMFPALAGLVRPLKIQATQHLVSAWNVLRESMGVTVFYGVCAGVVGSGLGVVAGWAAGPSPVLRRAVLAASFILMAMPASLTALGILVIAAKLPPIFDVVTRSGWVVGIAYGIRFAPLAAVLCLHAGCRLPRSQSDAGALHGVPLRSWVSRVVLPHVRPTLMVCGLVVALLSLAEVSTTLLLQAPGESSFPARIFSVLDNVSEKALAALCVVYVLGGAVLLSVFFGIDRIASGERER
jgi:ABC-type Fe3+ transport system permease subunit